MTTFTVYYSGLWLDKNARICKRISSSLGNNCDRVAFLASIWCSANGLFRVVSLVDMQRDWYALLLLDLLMPICFLLLSSCEDTIPSLFVFFPSHS